MTFRNLIEKDQIALDPEENGIALVYLCVPIPYATLGTESKIKARLYQADVMMESAWQVSQPKEVQHLPLHIYKVLHARI